MMADTIDIPGFKGTKKTTLYAVGGGLVLVVAVVYYRSKKAAAAQSAAVTQAGTNEIDPATGYPYGSPEDAAALATQTSYYQAGTADYGGGYSSGSPSPSQGTGFVSNAAWAQAYEQYAVNNVQSDSTTVAAALGKYLTGQPLSQDQLSVVEQAIAFEGLPPIAGTNGYPPSYQLQQAPTPTPTQTVPDGYYAIPSQGGIVYHVKGNKVWHVTKTTWQKLNPKPGVIQVNPGWLQSTGLPFYGDE